MTTAIYIGNDRVQVVTAKRRRGRLVVKRAANRSLPKGYIINGVITDPQALSELMRRLRREKLLPRSGVQLIVDSGNILFKTTVVPIVRSSHMSTIVKGEFADTMVRDSKMLYDYSVLVPRNEGGDGATILCCAAERALVESYIDLFVGINCSLDTIRLGLDCTIDLCRALPELGNGGYTIMERDGSTLVSTLFAGGRFLFCQRYRLLSDEGSSEYIDEIMQRISHLRQFNKSQNTGSELENIYLCGFGSDTDAVAAQITSLSGIATAQLSSTVVAAKKKAANFRLSEYCYTAGSFFE